MDVHVEGSAGAAGYDGGVSTGEPAGVGPEEVVYLCAWVHARI